MSRLLFLLSFFSVWVKSQTLTVNVQGGSCISFDQHIFAAGLVQRQGKQHLGVYRADPDLKMSDSLFISCDHSEAGNYLRTTLDTLHGHLNIYIQKKGSMEVRIVRFTPQLRLIADIPKTDIARLNNRAMLGVLPYFSGSRVYSIKSVKDSSGAQFFLMAYQLKSETENYDYLQRWQFAFERKNVSGARIIHADSRMVTMFVEVDKGPKKGEWILSINAKTGLLIRGSKLNAAGEPLVYLFGAARADTVNQLLHLMGEKQAPGVPKALTAHTFYYMRVDSLGQIVTRYDFRVPVTEQKRGNSKTSPGFSILFEGLRTDATGVEAQCDIYLNNEIAKGCYNYCSSVTFSLTTTGDGVTSGKNEIKSNRVIEDWLYFQDKSRMNGRLCPDSLEKNYRPLHAELPFPVKVKYRKENGTSVWLLRKTETGKGRLSFAKTATEKNTLKVQTLAELPKSIVPVLHVLPKNKFLVSSDDKEGRLILQGGTW